MLPAEKWARRISGVFGNQLAVESPAQAHAVLTAKPDGGYVVSVRAPLATKSGADELCSQFDTGGGRKGAAGINHLPESEVGRFIACFLQVFSNVVPPELKMNQLIEPYGGTLVNLIDPEESDALKQEAFEPAVARSRLAAAVRCWKC